MVPQKSRPIPPKALAKKMLLPLSRTAFASLLALVCGCGASSVESPPSPTAASHLPVDQEAPSYVPAAAPTTVADIPHPPKRDRASAAAEAIAESNRATAASAIALKASQEAAQAAAQAEKAAVRAAGLATPSSQPTAAQTVLYSTEQPDGAGNRQQIAKTIERLDQTLQSIDRNAQTSDGLNRVALAKKFLQSAHEAFAEGSYSEARSLAHKAATMIAPLTSSSTLPAR